ncbi:MAG TPA: DUF6800 family protein [Anaerolineae bacterium]
MKTRNHEIRRRRARRLKTWNLKERLQATADNRQKAKIIEKLRRVNPYLHDQK